MANYSLWDFERSIPSKILDRARQVVQRKRITDLDEVSPGEWMGTVHSSEGGQYGVFITLRGDDVVSWSCDCSYDWGNMCKHVAASLLQLRTQRQPPGMRRPGNLELTASQRRQQAADILEKFQTESPTTSNPATASDSDEIKLQTAPASGEIKLQTAPASDEIELRTRTPEQLYELCTTLPSTEQRILKIAALVWEPFSKVKLVEIFNDCNFKNAGINLYDRTAIALLINLKNLGFLQQVDTRYQVHPEFAQKLCDREYDTDPDFRKIPGPIRRRMELHPYWNPGTDMAERHFREMRLARYASDAERFKLHYWGAVHQPRSRYSQASMLEWWLPIELDVARLETLSPGIRAFLFSEKLSLLTFGLLPLDGYFYFIAEKFIQTDEKDREHLAVSISQIHLLRGDRMGIQKLGMHFKAVYAGVFAGILQLLAGDTNAANNTFQLATKTFRSETRNPKNVLTNLPGVFHILAQLKTLDSTLYPKIDDHIARALKSSADYGQVFKYLNAATLLLQNEKKAAQQLLHDSPPLHPLFRVFWYIVQYWVDETTIDQPRLFDFYQKLDTNGYRWLAAEMLTLLADLDPSDLDRWQEADRRLAELGIQPLVRLLPRVEAWETALNVLLGMGASAKTVTRESDMRIVWLVDFQNKRLQAKEQSFGKNGWTSGRNISDNRLRSGELKGITDQDRRIIAAVGYSDFDLLYHPEKVWLALVGHPLLFLWKSPDVAVQLEEEKPVLVAKEVAGGFQMQFSHNIEGEGIQVVKETPTRYKLLTITAEHARIARAMNGKSLFVPEQGADRLREAVSGLASIVMVQSAFEDANLPGVEPDSRTCVHLLPVGDGFHVELLAKPFADIPPYFKPGKGEPSVIALRDGQRIRTTRDLKSEKQRAESLREQVEILRDTRPNHGVWELEDADQCLELLTQLHPLVEAGGILLEWPKGEKFKVTKIAGFDQFKMSVREKNNWFEVTGEIRVDEDKVLTMQELLVLSEQSKGQFVELSPGKFLALTNEFRRRLRQINGLMALQKNGSLQLHPLAAPVLDGFASLLKDFEFDQKFKENRDRLRTAFELQLKLPKKFNATLRPYQLEGFEWLSRCAAGGVGACLADDMGLGKTVQALALLTDRAKLGPALVVAPASVCRNWLVETEKFAPTLTAILFGEGDRMAMIEEAKKGDIVVVTYDLMAREAEIFTKKKWATVILDEAQNIKNRATKRSETAMLLQADFKMVMTGTPLENHLGELWNLLQFINPGLLGSLDSFNERFAVPIEKYRDENRRDQLRRLVQPFILRRRKDEVLKELPAKTEITLRVELSPEERAFYEALRRSALEKLTSNDPDVGAGEKHLRILAEIMRLRRAACHPQLVDPNAGFKDSSKLRLFGEIVEELLDNGHKALVFSQFVSHLGILEDYLKKKKIKYQYLDGQTALPTRQKRIEAFQRGEGDLFLISLKAGGVGLNLTAADYVIHMDPWWNPAVEDQATDRAHRIGQEKPVTVYRIVAEETIEEKILKLHEHKRDLADSLLTGSDMSAKLSADDLLKLIAEER